MFTKYGYTTIGVVAIISFVLIVLSFFIQNTPTKVVLLLAAAAILFFTLNFFRDPDRNTPVEEGIIVSPADGKIIVIKNNVSSDFAGQKLNLISIFMSPMDVHVNRIPLSGTIEYLRYHQGKYLAAFDEHAMSKNERMEIGIASKYGKILFTQVAGFLARRIVNELKIGDAVKTGTRFGMIKFGSRVDFFVPANFKPYVKINDKVKAGESILFELVE
ncbi:MAG: phosphatidylserine decarboxylase family protein [Ignavibacteria bacterium]|nr:phosphatidylserine decarboxylase family protein [Ignavibacteria bacterium]